MQPRWLVVAAWAVLFIYAFPGYLNWDSTSQMLQARHATYDDWHPPMMAAIWRVFELFVRGPALMLLLQTLLFSWGVYQTFRVRFAERAAAILAAIAITFPPVLVPMAVVWKDAQMAAMLLAGVMLAMRPGWGRRALGLAMLLVACGVRDNAPAALPPLMLVVVASWSVRSRLKIIAVGAAITIVVALTAIAINVKLTDVRQYPTSKSLQILDVAGTLCYAPPLSDDEIRAELPGVVLLPKDHLQRALCAAYDPRSWFRLTFSDVSVFVQKPDEPDRAGRRAAWTHVMREYPGSYLYHRWQVMQEVLGLSPWPMWEPVCQSNVVPKEFTRKLSYDASLSFVQKVLGKEFVKLGETKLFRPWVYALLSLIVLAWAAWKRDAWLAALVGSGLLYELTYFFAASGPDYRYSHWMVVCCCIALATIFVERLREAR
ncbi:MAG: hypothetical protein JO257_05220 [Deltaproteobacteria bacterium]|nr:hypothetical protein [Deltaproteobacteria bacterium]